MCNDFFCFVSVVDNNAADNEAEAEEDFDDDDDDDECFNFDENDEQMHGNLTLRCLVLDREVCFFDCLWTGWSS